MSKRKRALLIWTLILVFSVCLSDTGAVMAALNGPDSGTGSEVEQDLGAAEEPDTVSDAGQFIEWLESHKNSGGRVKLTSDIVLKEFYYFTPNGAGLPDIFVDTDVYTITADGKITFMSDGHLIFQGKSADRGILHVAKGGMLTLSGIIVENSAKEVSAQYALWQEEGAGLVLENTYGVCQVSGEIHYADTPFVTSTASVCAIVGKGQQAGSFLPDQIRCDINYQGQIRYHELVPVSWDLAGSERQQEKRLRFQVKGFSSQVTYDVEPVCTVVYHDYPLTFTNVDAFMRATAYYFQGGYTKPEEELPIVVAWEYSFDGADWTTCKEETVSNVNAGFSISFERSQWDTVRYPYVYIRLQGNKDGKKYFSNVLRYAADNMGEAEDLGSRKGGTSAVDPSDEPTEDTSDTASDDRKPQDTESGNTDSENTDSKNANSENTDSQNADSENTDSKNADSENTDSKNTDSKKTDPGKSDSGKLESKDRDESDGGGSTSSDENFSSENTGDPVEEISDGGNEDLEANSGETINSPVNDSILNMAPPAGRRSSENLEDLDSDVTDKEEHATDLTASRAKLLGDVNEGTGTKETRVDSTGTDAVEKAGKQQTPRKQSADAVWKVIMASGILTLLGGVIVAGYFVHADRGRRKRHRCASSKKKGHGKRNVRQ